MHEQVGLLMKVPSWQEVMITMLKATFLQHPETAGSYLCCCLRISYNTFHLQQAHRISRSDVAPAAELRHSELSVLACLCTCHSW